MRLVRLRGFCSCSESLLSLLLESLPLLLVLLVSLELELSLSLLLVVLPVSLLLLPLLVLVSELGEPATNMHPHARDTGCPKVCMTICLALEFADLAAKNAGLYNPPWACPKTQHAA